MRFFFQFVYMMDCADGVLYVESSLHLWDEAYLIMVDDVFDVFLDSCCEYFHLSVPKGHWTEIFFPC